MSKKRNRKPKHIPHRTCVGCKEVQAKRSLIRIVRTAEGVRIDQSGKYPGRGAYLHDERSCWEKGIKRALANSLKTTLTSEDIEILTSFMEALPEENHSMN